MAEACRRREQSAPRTGWTMDRLSYDAIMCWDLLDAKTRQKPVPRLCSPKPRELLAWASAAALHVQVSLLKSTMLITIRFVGTSLLF